MDQITYIGDTRTISLDPAVWGGKASGLATIAQLGISVPPAFVLPVSFCQDYYKSGKVLPTEYSRLIQAGMTFLQSQTGKIFGDTKKPLLVSVRSGAPVSLPGMMDTLLNVGVSPRTIEGLIYASGSPRFAWDCYRRFIEQVASTIHNVHHGVLLEVMSTFLMDHEYPHIKHLDFAEMTELCSLYEKSLRDRYAISIPYEPHDQLDIAVKAVLDSWDAPRAREYRSAAGISGFPGTAVIVQAMVFGNSGSHSGAGIAFSRNPWNGDQEMIVDFEYSAQGEEIVSGTSRAQPGGLITPLSPSLYESLKHSAHILENHFQDMQDLEFTFEDGRLFILQTRTGKRSSYAALKIAVDLVKEGVLNPRTGFMRIQDIPRENLVITRIKTDKTPLTRGTAASIGVVSGRVAFTREQAESLSRDSPVILILNAATPDDIPSLHLVAGLVTRLGSRISHAAVVARQMEKVCIVGCTDIIIHKEMTSCQINTTIIRVSEFITLDGNNGAIYPGEVEMSEEFPDDLFREIEQLQEQAG